MKFLGTSAPSLLGSLQLSVGLAAAVKKNRAVILQEVSMIIGFASQWWKGANLVTHELLIRKTHLETKLHHVSWRFISLFHCRGQAGA